VKSFTLYVDGREIYAQEIADALTADMTPFRGIGANTALRDAATLCLALAAVAHGDADLFQALTSYEYGFNAVKTSLRDMKRFHTKGLSKTAVKLFLRVADRVPPLKAAFFGR
jgi:2-polyprenyl-6-methoxyphenol hydroxylase-like FAD-dependent oxidoreductase